jgi:hypothetical protein
MMNDVRGAQARVGRKAPPAGFAKDVVELA